MKTPTQDEALRTMIPASEKAKTEFEERQTDLEARHAPFTQIFAPFVELAQHNPHIAWLRACWTALEPFATSEAYLNFMDDPREEPVLVQTAYGANYKRLVALKNCMIRAISSTSTRISSL